MLGSKYYSSSSAPIILFPLASLLHLQRVLSGSESKDVETPSLLPVIQQTECTTGDIMKTIFVRMIVSVSDAIYQTVSGLVSRIIIIKERKNEK